MHVVLLVSTPLEGNSTCHWFCCFPAFFPVVVFVTTGLLSYWLTVSWSLDKTWPEDARPDTTVVPLNTLGTRTKPIDSHRKRTNIESRGWYRLVGR